LFSGVWVFPLGLGTRQFLRIAFRSRRWALT
jgi:hypothetical protein